MGVIDPRVTDTGVCSEMAGFFISDKGEFPWMGERVALAGASSPSSVRRSALRRSERAQARSGARVTPRGFPA